MEHCTSKRGTTDGSRKKRVELGITAQKSQPAVPALSTTAPAPRRARRKAHSVPRTSPANAAEASGASRAQPAVTDQGGGASKARNKPKAKPPTRRTTKGAGKKKAVADGGRASSSPGSSDDSWPDFEDSAPGADVLESPTESMFGMRAALRGLRDLDLFDDASPAHEPQRTRFGTPHVKVRQLRPE
ncbi:uncharacterized protein LOC144163080 [Haemaphysalis longicornis]